MSGKRVCVRMHVDRKKHGRMSADENYTLFLAREHCCMATPTRDSTLFHGGVKVTISEKIRPCSREISREISPRPFQDVDLAVCWLSFTSS